MHTWKEVFVSSDALRLVRNPTKSQRKVVLKKISCIIEGDSHPRKSFPREPGTLGTKHDVKYSKGTWRQTKNRERMGSSRRIIQKYAKKDAPAEQRGIWPKNIFKLKDSDKATCYVLIEAKEMLADKATCYVLIGAKEMLAPTSKRPEEREFVVDSVAVMHMMIKKRIKLRGNRHFANVQNPYCGSHCKRWSANQRGSTSSRSRLNLFVTAITRGNACSPTAWEALRTPRIPLWVGQGPRLTKNGKSIICKTDTFVPLVVPGLSTSSGCNSSETSTPQDVSSTSPAQERSEELAPQRWCGSTPKTRNPNKRMMTVEMRTTVCEIFLSGWRSSQIFWRTQNCMHPHTGRRNQI